MVIFLCMMKWKRRFSGNKGGLDFMKCENGIDNLFRLGLRFDRGDLCENRYYTWTES